MTPPTPARDGDIRTLMGQASKHLAGLRIDVGDEMDRSQLPNVEDVRRRRSATATSAAEAGFLTLVRDENGLYDWQVDAGPSPSPQRRAQRRGGLFETDPIDQVAFQPVAGSQVSAFLDKLDGSFNKRYGLYDLNGARVNTVAPAGRILLVIHGTFSKCDAIAIPFKPLLDAAAAGGYDQVLLFEHPTLAVSPMLNALDLARAFRGTAAHIDVIAHSRGGLVARWWLEVLDPAVAQRARVVFFGSPLMGTALASPFRLRSALKLITNLAIVLQHSAQLASLAMPLFSVAQGLMALVASASSVMAKAPVADAAVAMVPGLAAMSRYGPDSQHFILGNHELMKLGHGMAATPAGYHMVTSNFEPDAIGWQFWRAFREAKTRASDLVADVLFAGENDLVVDTPSMTRLSPSVDLIDPARRLDFKTNPTVHHLNYFHQPASADFVRSVFGMP